MDDTFELQLTSDTGTDVSVASGAKAHIMFNLQRIIPLPESVCAVALTGGVIPRSFFPVSSLNDQFTVTIDGTPYEVNIAHGSYNAYELVTYFVDQMTALSSLPWQGAYDKNNNKMKFIVIDAGYTTVTIDFYGTTNELFGFTTGSHSADISGGFVTFTSNRAVDVNGNLSADIRIGGLTFVDALSPEGGTNILQRIYFTTPFNGLEIMRNTGYLDWKTAATSGKSVSVIEIIMTDRFGRELNFNGVDWQITIFIRKLRR